MVKRIDYDADDQPDPLPRRRPTACVCDGAAVGPCPGPLNCPYSGLGPEEEEMMDLKELIALKEEYLLTLDDADKDDWYSSERRRVAQALEGFIAWLNLKGWTP